MNFVWLRTDTERNFTILRYFCKGKLVLPLSSGAKLRRMLEVGVQSHFAIKKTPGEFCYGIFMEHRYSKNGKYQSATQRRGVEGGLNSFA